MKATHISSDCYFGVSVNGQCGCRKRSNAWRKVVLGAEWLQKDINLMVLCFSVGIVEITDISVISIVYIQQHLNLRDHALEKIVYSGRR